MLTSETPSFFSRLSTYDRSKSYDSETLGESSEAGVRRTVSLQRNLPSFSSALDPPLASRHALFSHHRTPTSPIPIDPPSPTPSSTSSAFSPASAFLSRFSSNASLPSTPDGPGAVVLGYTLGKVLGRGGFSTVRLATNAKGQFACKIVKRDDLSDRSGSLEKFEEEIRILQQLPRHPSLLPLLEMERTSYATFLITPVLLGGNLLDVLRREGGSDKTARRWFPGVVAAVTAMHEGYEGFKGGMLHGDLKLDNFLVDHDGRVVACDFYMAKIIDEPTIPLPRRPRQSVPTHLEPIGLPAHFPSASLPYAPPELLSTPLPPSLAQDMWALGIVLYALLSGKLPFVDAFDPRLQMKILRGQWDAPEHIGREWIQVLKGCLDGNRDTRWTIRQVRESDAVVGWKEVKQRSRSRSRRRVDEYGADPLTSQPRGVSRDRYDPDSIAFENLHVRGRSQVPDLPFARTSRSRSTGQPQSSSTRTMNTRDRSRGRQPQLSPSYQDSRSRSTGRQPQKSPTTPISSRSRSRTPWVDGTHLMVVDEENDQRGRRR